MSNVLPIKDFPGYYISDTGNVYTVNYNHTGRIKKLKTCKQSCGYIQIVLCVNNKKYHKYIHRLVAEAFIPNRDNKPQVNHKNGDKTDNRVENLEFVTASENLLHAARILKVTNPCRIWLGKQGKMHPRSKTVLQIQDGKIIREFGSLLEAQRNTGISFGNIGSVCKGLRKKAGGYEWRYKY